METLCERLQFHADQGTMPPVQITQAKEKWGELSVNYAGGDDDIAAGIFVTACPLNQRPHEGLALLQVGNFDHSTY